MRTRLHRGRGVAGLLLVAAALTVGCGGKKIEILRYPSFFDPEDESKNIGSLVVLPFRNQAGNASSAMAGEAMSEELFSLLAGSGTYNKVYNRSDLKDLMDQQDLRIATGGDPNALATAFRKRGAVDAMLTGAITFYDSTPPKKYVTQIPVPTYNAITKQWGIKLQDLTKYKTSAQVTVAATLTRIRDGAPIHATGPLTGKYQADSTSIVPQGECLRRATNQAVAMLRNQFVVTRSSISVDSNTFRLARAYYDGEWDEDDEFTTRDDKAYIVLKLPPQCDRNWFRVTIVREDRKADLFVQKIRWLKINRPAHPGSGVDVNPARIGIGWEFSPRQIAEKGNGPGKYVAKFYAGPKPVLFVDFDIKSD